MICYEDIKKPSAPKEYGTDGNSTRELSSNISISQRQGNCQG